MIVNLNSMFPPAVEKLQALKQFEFYLTGSRFFGGATVESDWDFFVEYSAELESTLKDLGFERDSESTYEDPSIALVMSKYETWQGRKTKLDIQLVKDAAKKLAIQTQLKNHWLYNAIPGSKEMRKAMWYGAYAGFNAALTPTV